MKTILYMAITPNGFVAGTKDDTSWVSKADWKEFLRTVKRTGNMVIGSRTYEIMAKGRQFPVPGVLNVVMTKRVKQIAKNKWDNVIFTDESPRGVIKHLKEKGFKEVLIAGGGKVAASFLQEKLIDELYLTIEPVVFGRGIKLFENSKDFGAKLRLIDTFQVGPHEIQLHYAVKK